MHESPDDEHIDESDPVVPGPTGAALYRRAVLASLARGEFPAQRSRLAVLRLIRTVAEWRENTGLAVTIVSTASRVRCEFTLTGADQPGWFRDLRTALGGLGILTKHRTPSRLPMPLGEIIELERVHRAPAPLPDPFSRDEREQPRTDLVVEAWPAAEFGASPDLVDLLFDHPGSMLRFVLAPASAVEHEMLADTLVNTWDRFNGADLASYRGAIIRMRTFVGMQSGEVPAGLRAAVRAWGSGLALQVIPDVRSWPAWFASPSRIAARAVPEGLAECLMRLPVASMLAVPGMPSHRVTPKPRPLDPMPPRAAAPVRLGTAYSATGRRVDAVLDLADLTRHTFIEGRTGAGKTTLLVTLARELSERDCSYTYLDPHGTGVTSVLGVLSPAAAWHTTVVRHGELGSPVPQNILTERDPDRRDQIVQEFIELVQDMLDPRQEGIVGPRWKRWFSLIADGVVAHFGLRASLLHVTAVASDLSRVRSLATRIAPTHPELANHLLAEVGNLKGDDAATLTSWAMSKLHPLVASRAMRAILGTGVDAVDVDEAMNGSGGLLVDLGSPVLGASSARMLGAMWMLKHWVAMGRRKTSRPHVLIVDEAHLFTFGALPAMLAEGRKFGLGLVLASQSVEALPARLDAAVEANVGSFVSLRLGLRTVSRASARLEAWPSDELVRLPDLTAAASLSRSGVSTDPFQLQVDHHARMARLGLPDLASVERTARAEASSRALFADPYRHLAAPTDREITLALRPTAPGEPEPRAVPPTPRAGGAALGDALDDWMAARDVPSRPS